MRKPTCHSLLALGDSGIGFAGNGALLALLRIWSFLVHNVILRFVLECDFPGNKNNVV